MNKSVIYMGATVGGIAGGFLGGLMDHGNPFGLWGILFSLIGGIAGIWGAVKIQQ